MTTSFAWRGDSAVARKRTSKPAKLAPDTMIVTLSGPVPLSRLRQAEAASDATTKPPVHARRKPGKPTTHDWPLHVAREVIRIIRADEPVPTAPRLVQYCEDTLGYQPDIRAMQKLLRTLLG